MDRSESLWRMLMTMLVVGLILAVADLLVISLQVLLLILAGVLFGIFLNGVSYWLTKHLPLSYRWSYGLVVALLAALMAGGFTYLGSQMAHQASALSTELQSAWQRMNDQIGQSQWAQPFLPDASQSQQMLASATSALPKIMQGVRWIGWGLTAVLVIGIVGLYTAYDPELYRSGLVKLVPRDQRPRADEVLNKLNSALGRWIIGRLISMGLIGVLTAIGLALLGVPLPVALGVIAALLTFIPNIGPILAAVPQALLALQVGTSTALYVILFNIILQTVESYLIEPMVQRYEVSLPPVLTIFAQLLMAVLVGIIGVVMAAPLMVIVLVLIQMLYIRDQLGDPSPGELVNDS